MHVSVHILEVCAGTHAHMYVVYVLHNTTNQKSFVCPLTFVNLYFPVINYEITVVTGDVAFAGTNAKVFIQIYGDKGKTEIVTLESRSNNFERNTTEIFKVSKLGFHVSGGSKNASQYLNLQLFPRPRPKMWGRCSRSA